MKIAVYEVRPDEMIFFSQLQKSLNIELKITDQVPSMQTAEFSDGCVGISILGQGCIDADLLQKLFTYGVRYISTRTIGTNHIDLKAARALGIQVCNASYAPNGVAEFTIMLILMCLRQYKQALWRGQVNDFSLQGLQGREMKDLTVGVIGTGRIGSQVIKDLSGFGCRIIAYDPYPKDSMTGICTYVSLDEIYKTADIITLHTPLTPENRHMINHETLGKMKKGVILVNCARGDLCDIDALVDGVESEQIGALGMDTLEGEEGIIHADHRTDILSNRNWFYLHQFRNVVMTQHMAFYTDSAVKSMAECGIRGICQMAEGKKCETQII